MIKSIDFSNQSVGKNSKCFIIAEVGLAHEGSLGTAFSFIEAVAKSGADAVKFQTHIAAEESSSNEKFRVNVFPQDLTRYDYWQRTSFTEDQWGKLKSFAESLGLVFLSTPFSIAAVKLLRKIGIEGWKIGSGETNNLMLLEEVAKDRKPVFLSTGMSFTKEVTSSVNLLKSKKVPVILMQCTNIYPCPPEKMGLGMIPKFIEEYKIPVGFSDHSGEITPGISAYTLGARVIEVHVTWSKQCFGPDVKSSLTFDQFSRLVDGIRLLEKSFASTYDKDTAAENLIEMRNMFMKGLVATVNLPRGTTIEKKHLDSRKPCTGIPVSQYSEIIGKTVNKEIMPGEHINWSDIE